MINIVIAIIKKYLKSLIEDSERKLVELLMKKLPNPWEN